MTLNSSIILTVVTTYGLKQLGLDNTVAHKGRAANYKVAANSKTLLQIK